MDARHYADGLDARGCEDAVLRSPTFIERRDTAAAAAAVATAPAPSPLLPARRWTASEACEPSKNRVRRQSTIPQDVNARGKDEQPPTLAIAVPDVTSPAIREKEQVDVKGDAYSH